MSHRSVELSSYEDFLREVFPNETPTVNPELGDEARERDSIAKGFPFTVVLKLSYPELDFANRWCWRHFGPPAGRCLDAGSEYSVCATSEAHSHEGRWHWRWLEKTDYDFGFCEWYFSSITDRDNFIAFIPEINWGENYPK